jgi:hypothetical protein
MISIIMIDSNVDYAIEKETKDDVCIYTYYDWMINKYQYMGKRKLIKSMPTILKNFYKTKFEFCRFISVMQLCILLVFLVEKYLELDFLYDVKRRCC